MVHLIAQIYKFRQQGKYKILVQSKILLQSNKYLSQKQIFFESF